MSRESALWHWLAKARTEQGSRLHMNRIENSAGPGMPDVEGCLEGYGQFWLELKSSARPKRADTAIRFKVRPKQVEWMNARWKAGAPCYWLLQVGSAEERRLYLLPGRRGAWIKTGMTESELRTESVLCTADKKHTQLEFLSAATRR